MIINIGICGSFLIMLLIISFAFFFKEKVNSLENDCFKKIVALTVIGLLLETLFYIRILYLHPNVDFIYKLMTVAVYIYYIWWMLFFVKYGIVYFFSIKDKNNQKYKKAITTLIIVYLLFSIVTIFLPFNIVLNEHYYYPEGISTYAQYIFASLGMVLIIIFAVINHKKILKKESLPFIACTF